MFKLKLKTDNWENMNSIDLAVDFGRQMYENGFKRGFVVCAVGMTVGIIAAEIIRYNEDKVKQIAHDTKVKILNKLEKS